MPGTPTAILCRDASGAKGLSIIDKGHNHQTLKPLPSRVNSRRVVVSASLARRECSLREAAEFLSGKGGANSAASKSDGSRNDSPQPMTEKGLRPLDYLQASHEAVQALGISSETCAHFGAGFAPKGIMRGRFAIPIHDRNGNLLAYCGRATKDESPALLFPNSFDPRGAIFNAHRIAEGDLFLVRDPVQALTAQQNGVENVVAFLTENVTALQLEQLAALMDERKCEHLEVF